MSLRYYFAETSREKGLIERQTETVLESKGILSRDFLELWGFSVALGTLTWNSKISSMQLLMEGYAGIQGTPLPSSESSTSSSVTVRTTSNICGM